MQLQPRLFQLSTSLTATPKMPRLDCKEIAACLRQTESTRTRRKSISHFGKALRRGDRFQPAWEAVGHAAGLASLMAEFSINDVRFICKALGRTASAIKAREERCAAMDELVKLLYHNPLDQRPLREIYQNIIPACSSAVVEEWQARRDVEWTTRQQKLFFNGHRELNEARFLNAIFSPSSKHKHLTFSSERMLFSGNLDFCEKILSTLVSREGNVRVPFDFMSDFAMPLLKRLLKARFDEETRTKFLNLVMRCVEKHPDAVASQLHLRQGGILQYVIQRRYEEPSDHLDTHLARLIGLLPTNEQPPTLANLHDAVLVPRGSDSETRYELLSLLLLHVKHYSLDINDGSETSLQRLSHIPLEGNRWPAALFFSIRNDKAMQLLQKLTTVHPRGDFISPVADWSTKTVLEQTRGIVESDRGDVDIVRALLEAQSKSISDDGWRDRVRALVTERKKKAQESREYQGRTFWAKAALNLCVAAGDMVTLKSTLHWARRFNKDGPTVMALYNEDVFASRELESLLGVVPDKDKVDKLTASISSGLASDINLANRILLDLIETAAMISQEPGVPRDSWSKLLRLPKVVVDWRLNKAVPYMQTRSSRVPGLKTTETVWKPTIEALVQIEETLLKTTSEALGSSRAVDISGVYVLKRLPASEAPMLAELAEFLLGQMRRRLGPERVKVRMGEVVQVVLRVAQSDQPWLACPFVRHLIMDGDDNSSWHRQLLSAGFLSSLPAKAARELLETMGDAMRNKMRAQNSRPRDGNASAAPSLPGIKVTTVKMMAQLLQSNVFIDAQASCDILVGLLAEARHIDAQATLVNSLLATMEDVTCPPQLEKRIFGALEDYVVPVAAQLSERQVLTEVDWELAAEDNGKLPDVSEESPLLELLVERGQRDALRPEVKVRLAALIGDALRQSSVNNNRWMQALLVKNQWSLDDTEVLPMAPAAIRVAVSFFRGWTSYAPSSLLLTLRQLVMSNLNPPPSIARITQTINATSDLINSNAGSHWLTQVDNPGTEAFRLGLHDAALMLQRPAYELDSKLEKGHGIETSALQDFVMAAASHFVSAGDFGLLEELVAILCRKRLESRRNWFAWRSNCMPLIKDIIERVDAVRARDDSKLTTRRPLQRLNRANVFRLRVKVLPVPYPLSEDLIGAADVDDFVSDLSGLIDQLASRSPYHDNFAHLKMEMLRAHNRINFARYALGLVARSRTEQHALADCLRLELAGDFLMAASDPVDQGVVGEARDLVRGWVASGSEEVSAMGDEVAGRLLRERGGWFRRGMEGSEL